MVGGCIVPILFLLRLENILGNIFVKTESKHFSAASVVEDRLRDYGYIAASPLVFDIRICGAAYVILSSSTTQYYVIMIQGKVGHKTKSVIYLDSHGLLKKTARDETDITLSKCRDYRKFRVSWGGTHIKLERYNNCSTWESYLSVAREASIAESDITDIGLLSSNIINSVDSHWKIDTQDNMLRLKTPNPNVMNDLSHYGYEVFTSTTMELSLKTCKQVCVKFYSMDAHILAEVDIESTKVFVKNPSGAVSTISGFSNSCNLLKTYTMRWTQNTFHLVFNGGSFESTTSVHLTGTKPIKRIGFSGHRSVVWNWKTDAAGSCFYVPCGPSCSTPLSTAPQSTTTIQLSTADESTKTTGEMSTESESQSTSITSTIGEIGSTILQYTTTDQPFTRAQNACCCVPHSLLVAPLKLFTPPVVNKKDTSRHKRSLTSANDDRPSSKYIGYTGSGFMLFIFIGVIIIDIPNLLNMVKIMRRNVSSRFCKKRRIRPIEVR